MKVNTSQSNFNILEDKSNIYADMLHQSLKENGINFASGVPCGVQKHIISNISNDPLIQHIPATKEAEAIGISAGAYLTGLKPVVYMQNSGFFDSSNDIASLLIPYKIPIFLTITWRGCPGEDAPQHYFTGKATIPLLKSLKIHFEILDKTNQKKIDTLIQTLIEKMEETKLPVALLIKRGWNK